MTAPLRRRTWEPSTPGDCIQGRCVRQRLSKRGVILTVQRADGREFDVETTMEEARAARPGDYIVVTFTGRTPHRSAYYPNYRVRVVAPPSPVLEAVRS